jgi:hypothetical protein
MESVPEPSLSSASHPRTAIVAINAMVLSDAWVTLGEGRRRNQSRQMSVKRTGRKESLEFEATPIGSNGAAEP